MKKFLPLLLLFLVFASSCKSKKKTVESEKRTAEIETNARIPVEEADSEQKKRAYDFGKRILNACNTSRFKPFTTSEALPEVIANMSEGKLTKTCLTFRQKYGEFKDIRLQEIIPNKKNETVVYRYKADYTKKIANKELRVIMNKDNKLVGVKSTDWVDNYKPIK